MERLQGQGWRGYRDRGGEVTGTGMERLQGQGWRGYRDGWRGYRDRVERLKTGSVICLSACVQESFGMNSCKDLAPEFLALYKNLMLVCMFDWTGAQDIHF